MASITQSNQILRDIEGNALGEITDNGLPETAKTTVQSTINTFTQKIATNDKAVKGDIYVELTRIFERCEGSNTAGKWISLTKDLAIILAKIGVTAPAHILAELKNM